MFVSWCWWAYSISSGSTQPASTIVPILLQYNLKQRKNTIIVNKSGLHQIKSLYIIYYFLLWSHKILIFICSSLDPRKSEEQVKKHKINELLSQALFYHYIKGLHHWVTMILGLENLSLWQKHNSLVSFNKKNFKCFNIIGVFFDSTEKMVFSYFFWSQQIYKF